MTGPWRELFEAEARTTGQSSRVCFWPEVSAQYAVFRASVQERSLRDFDGPELVGPRRLWRFRLKGCQEPVYVTRIWLETSPRTVCAVRGSLPDGLPSERVCSRIFLEGS